MRRVVVEAVVLFAVIAGTYFSALPRLALHYDEMCWITRSGRFEKILEGDFSDPVWTNGPGRYVNTVFSYYVIGAARQLAGFGADSLGGPYRLRLSFEENQKLGRVVGPEVLFWSRAGVTATAVLALWIGVLLIKAHFSRWIAYPYLFAILTNGYLTRTLCRAMNEGTLLLFVFLTLLFIDRLLREPSSGDYTSADRAPIPKLRLLTLRIPELGWLILTGITIGLAAATKLNGAILIAATGVCIVCQLYRSPFTFRRRYLRFALMLAIVGLSSFAAFVIVNPALWSDPVHGASRMFHDRLKLIAVQEGGGRVWQPWFAKQSDRFGIQIVHIFKEFSLWPHMFSLSFGLFTIGFIRCVVDAYQWLRQRTQEPFPAALLIVSVFASAPTFFSPLDWPRYYFLPVVFSCIYIVIGFKFFIVRVGTWWMTTREELRLARP